MKCHLGDCSIIGVPINLPSRFLFFFKLPNIHWFKPLRCKDYVIVNWLFWEQTSHFKILHQWPFYSLTNNWRNNHQINLLWKSFDADAFWIIIFFFFSVLHIFSHLNKIWYIIYLRDLKKIPICFFTIVFSYNGSAKVCRSDISNKIFHYCNMINFNGKNSCGHVTRLIFFTFNIADHHAHFEKYTDKVIDGHY